MPNVDARRLRLAVIPGDGIGREVTTEGLRVLDSLAQRADGPKAFVVFEYEHFPWGCQYYLETGHMMKRVLTPDLGGTARTQDVTDAIISYL